MKWPHLKQPKQTGTKPTCWAGATDYEKTPKGKIQNTTFIYGRNGGPKSRRTTKPG